MCLEKVIKLPLLVYKLLYFWQFPADAPLVSDMLNQKDCGVSNYNISDLIINGADAPRNAWPWQVLVITNQSLCGGTIIDREWILTAAHCITPFDTFVYLGEADFNTLASPYRYVSLKVLHPQHIGFFHANDIGLLKLHTPIDYTDAIRPICLPEGNIWDASPCFITGYGQTTRNVNPTDEESISRKLKQLRVGIMNPRLCQMMSDLISPPHFKYNLCLDTPEKSGAYSGDSGGPLSCYKNGRFYLLGVANRVADNKLQHIYPDIYLSVSHYLSWIQSYIGIQNTL